MNAIICPCCGSTDIDLDRRECRACLVGLPIGAFDVRPKRLGRSGSRTMFTQSKMVLSDKRTESITGGSE